MTERMFDTLDLLPLEAFVEDPYPHGWDPFDTPESDSGPMVLPSFLDDLSPGPALAALLSSVEPTALTPHSLVTYVRHQQRLVSHHNATYYTGIAALSDALFAIDEDWEVASASVASELRGALRMTRRTADAEVDFAHELEHRLSRVGDALAAGDIDMRRARVISYGTGHLDDEDAREVVDRVIEDAPRLTTGQLNAKVRKLCVETDPEEAKSRYLQALEQRKVLASATVEGTVGLHIENGAPNLVAEAFANIDYIAEQLRTSDDNRNIDQVRADVALDILAGRMNYKTTGRGTVDLVVDITTLAGLDENPAELSGYGPVIADIARQVAEEQEKAEWRWTVTDSTTGQVVHNGITKRRPKASDKRHVHARHRTCIFPGCPAPAIKCDIDHREPWANTHRTDKHDLYPLCRNDHCRRHAFGWEYRPLPGGDFEWTSRLGHRYTTSGLPPPEED